MIMMTLMSPEGRKRWRFLLGILKDKASLIKSSLLAKRNTSTHISVILATTHDPSSPPSEEYVEAVLSYGHGSRATACACVEAVMDRLHNTRNAFVALKCLVLLHNILMHGSFILKDQLSFYPSAGGRNFLNMSIFRHESDADAWEISSWVRWYAGVVEQNLIASRVLGFFLCSSSRIVNPNADKEEKVSGLPSSDLLKEVECLVGFVEQVCESPDSLHLRKNDLVNEVVRLAADNYGLVQREMSVRVKECQGRMDGLRQPELTHLLDILMRLENSRERLLLLFINRKRNDALWDLIRDTKIRVLTEKEKRENTRLVVVGRRGESNELTRFGERVSGSGQLFRFTTHGGAWLDLDRVHLTVSAIG